MAYRKRNWRLDYRKMTDGELEFQERWLLEQYKFGGWGWFGRLFVLYELSKVAHEMKRRVDNE